MSYVNATRSGRRAGRSTRSVPKVFLALAGAVLALAVAGCAGAGATALPAPPIPQPATPASLTKEDVDGWLDGLLPTALTQSGIAGATVSVVHDGKLVTARGYGYADTGAGDGEPVLVDPARTLFRPGSVSKLVTATAVMRLVEQGKLDLDADIDQYLDYDLPRRYDAKLTLRHLLTHTAGFEERLAGLIGTGPDPVNLRESLVTDPPEQVFEPGTTPAYSNYGYGLAGYLVERASGAPFEEYVQREILDLVGMDSSTFHQPLPAPLRDRMASGYPSTGQPAQPFEIVGQPPAGALSAPATDMARFMLAHLGALPAEQSPVSRETLALMHSPALDGTTLGGLAEGRRMTLGFFEESRNGHRIIGHGGDTNYFHSHLHLYPDDGAGIFVSFNSSGRAGTETLALRESVLSGFADRYFPGPETPVRAASGTGGVDEQTSREHARAAAGRYVSARGFQSTFLSAADLMNQVNVSALDGGRLLFEPGPASVSPAVYEEIAPWVWREVGGHQILAMRVDDGGTVTAIGHDSAFTLLPVGPAQAAAPPVIIGSVLVLLASLLAWPAGALLRRLRRRPARPDGAVPATADAANLGVTGAVRPDATVGAVGAGVDAAGSGAARSRAGRLVRLASRVGVASALLALVGWVMVFVSVMGLNDVPAPALRLVQVLQLVGVVALVPAALRLVGDLRHRTGWVRTAGSALVLLALAGTAWFAVAFRLLAPSVSY